MSKVKIKETLRGFSLGNFEDNNGVKCSIQMSSSDDCIWLGASEIGITIGYPWRCVSNEEIISKFGAKSMVANNRMHLNRKQVKKLLPLLIKFVETGEI